MTDPGQLSGFVSRLAERVSGASDDGVALLLVHCAAVERSDAAHGFVATEKLREEIELSFRSGMLRQGDAFEWLSRDEAALVLRPCPSEGIAALAAQKALRLLTPAGAPGERAIVPDAAAGVALVGQHAAGADQLLRQAKLALRSARLMRERWALYEPRGEEKVALDTRRYEARLPQAIAQNALTLHFQPQIDLRSRRIVGAEALLRWRDEELGQVPPHLAVAAAEASGLIHELTLWVASAAVRQCAAFQRIDRSLEMSINVSPTNLHQAELPEHIDLALRTWGLRGSSLTVEVTETAMLGDQKAAIEALHQLKRCGVGISIDDFGTGYSSMYWLAQMPLDELKIDMVFVRSMLEVPQHAKIVRSLIELSRSLELRVIAEGVETEDVASTLWHLGCNRAQGYYHGKPMPAEEFVARLAEQK